MGAITKPSVQSLLLQMHFNGQPLSTGTGFVVNTPTKGPHLLTNRHNVTGRHQDTGQPLSKTLGVPSHISVLHNKKGALGSWLARDEPLYVGTAPRWVEHPVLGAKADFVALKLTELTDVDLYPYEITSSEPKIRVGPADPVSVIGFPFGMTAGGAFGVWATGFLASEPVVDFNGLPIQLVDCRTRQGQSGSPVLAYRAGGAVATEDGGTSIFSGPVQRFIGIYSGRINAESDLGMVWKVSALAELVAIL
jgi:hypothetical protein